MRFFVGNSAVIFPVRVDGLRYALRCYRSQTEDRERLRAVYGADFLPSEMVIQRFDGEKYIDVAICEWREGDTLRSVMERVFSLDHDSWKEMLRRLSASFESLAAEMLRREDWAHADLSGENIIVDEEFRMTLIDNDFNYIEALSIERGREICRAGTPAYQKRREREYGAEMDNFSIALISLSLRALATDPELWFRHPFEDGLLLDGEKIGSRKYSVLDEAESIMWREGEFTGSALSRALRFDKLGTKNLLPLFEFSTRQREVDTLALETFEELGLWGFRSSVSREVIIPPLFDEAFDFSGGEARVRLSRWWFYIDCEGQIVERCGDLSGRKPPKRKI